MVFIMYWFAVRYGIPEVDLNHELCGFAKVYNILHVEFGIRVWLLKRRGSGSGLLPMDRISFRVEEPDPKSP